MIGVSVLAAAMLQPAHERLIPAFFTGERLLEICSGPNRGQCWMYVAGVMDGMFHAETRNDRRTLCGGVELTNRKAAELAVELLREQPELQVKAAAVTVEMALRSHLPCEIDGPALPGHGDDRGPAR
ncbi:MAG TPA: Rap1a/Tai family immunity protein [Nitrospira sp.]|nr:Rap1a/Tai family immunity protein [Nitrospira sp.]